MRLYEIDYRHKKFFSLTSFTHTQKIDSYRELMTEHHCGLVTDAGSPGLSDPWKQLVKVCREWGISFEVLPWATALIPAVVGSYRDTSKFVYKGFLPKKKGKRTALKEILQSVYPVYVYESVYRVEKTLSQLQELGYQGEVLIARELSKLHEQYVTGSIYELLEKINTQEIVLKWEFVLGFMPSRTDG